MNSSHWFPWPMLFFLFIIIYCPIVAGRLHSVKFPTQRTGSSSMASDFLGLIFTEAGRDQPTSGLFVRSLPRAPVNLPPDTSFQAPQRRQQPRDPPRQSHAAPGKSSPYQRWICILCHFFILTMFIVFPAGSVGMFFPRATMGNHRTNLAKSLSPRAAGLPVAS